jgi:hypothetical protein
VNEADCWSLISLFSLNRLHRSLNAARQNNVTLWVAQWHIISDLKKKAFSFMTCMFVKTQYMYVFIAALLNDQSDNFRIYIHVVLWPKYSHQTHCFKHLLSLFSKATGYKAFNADLHPEISMLSLWCFYMPAHTLRHSKFGK